MKDAQIANLQDKMACWNYKFLFLNVLFIQYAFN